MRLETFFCAALLIPVAHVGAQVNFTSSNLPIVMITTQGTIVDEPKIPGDMGIIDNGPGVRNNVTDPFNNFNGKIGIEIRGSTSQSFPKKQFSIELTDANGEGIDASLLGMPKKDDWVLFAPYNDKSLMRDVLAYKIGRDMGDYASRSRYCELVLNGEYEGVYVLLEKIKRDKNRVNIDKLDPTEIAGDNLTGGYIIKIDKTSGSGGAGWTSAFPPPNRDGGQTIYFQYEYPKDTDIVPEQQTYIKNYMDAFENALAGENFKDPVNGYANYIDVPSFVDFFIANELTKNPDAYRLSTFMHKKKDSDGGKFYMGPIWDFNLGFGNVNYCTQGDPEGAVIQFNTICNGDFWLIPFWWDRLFSDEVFRHKIADRWTTLRSGPFQTSTLLSTVDSLSSVLQESQQRNFAKWPVLGNYIWPNYYIGPTFTSEVSWLKQWINSRLLWMDEYMADITTGVVDDGRFSVNAFPNPFNDNINLQCTGAGPGPVNVDVFDMMGRRHYHVEMNSQYNGSVVVTLDQHGLAPGTYIIRIRSSAGVITQKVIKKH